MNYCKLIVAKHLSQVPKPLNCRIYASEFLVAQMSEDKENFFRSAVGPVFYMGLPVIVVKDDDYFAVEGGQ